MRRVPVGARLAPTSVAAGFEPAARAAASRSAAARAGALAFVRDPLRIAMFVLSVLTISRVHQHYPLLAKLRPALLTVLAAGAYAYLNPRYLTRENIARLWPVRCIAALGVLACFSAAFGISLGGSASFILQTYSKTILYAILVVLSIRAASDLYTFLWAYAISCGILSYFSLFVFGLSRSSNSYVTRLSDLYTYDSNDVCVVMVVGLAFTLLLLQVSRGWKRWFLLLDVVGIAATIARSGSRGGFLGLAAFVLAGLLLVNSVSASRRITLLALLVGGLVVAAPPGYWKQMGTLVDPTDDYNYSSIDGRRALIERGVNYMFEYPAFGLGIDNFMKAECSISRKARERVPGEGIRCTPPHNSWVEAGAELGIPGLLVWGSMVIGGIIAMLRLRRRLPRAWRRGNDTERLLYGATHFFAVGMIGFAVSAFFVTFAWMDIVYIIAAFMAGLYVAIRAYQSSADGAPGPMAQGRVPGWRSVAGRARLAARAGTTP